MFDINDIICIKLEKDVAILNHTLNVPLLRNFSANFAPRIMDAAILKIWNVTYKMKTVIPFGISVYSLVVEYK